MSEDVEECVVAGAVSTIFRIAQMTGTSPIRMKRLNTGHSIRVSHNNIAQYLFITVITAVSIVTTGSAGSKDGFVWYCIALDVTVASALSVYVAPARMRSVMSALHNIQMINKELGTQKSLSLEKKKSLAIIMAVAYYSFSAILHITMMFPQSTGQFLYMVANEYQYLIVFVYVIEFAVCTLEVKAALSPVNDFLDYISKTKLEGIEAAFKAKRSSKTLAQTIHHLASMYTEVCQVVHSLDEAYGVVILMALSICFVNLVYMPYTLILDISGSNHHYFINFLETQWICINIFILLLLTEPCHKIQLEADKVNCTTSKLLIMCEDDEVIKQLENLSLNFLLNKVTYSPLRICTLSRGLFRSITVTVVTFLIILAQFHNM